jgi:glycogen debranching enzyme
MRRSLILLALPAVLAAQAPPSASAAARPVALDWRHGPLDLTGPARPAGYVSAVGRRAAAFGTETGTFEIWAWPLKLLYGFELHFKTPLYDAPIAGEDVARSVTVTPAGVSIVYAHPAFTVTQRVFAPLHEPAIVSVLEVEAVRPIEIIARFRPALQYAWPASLGGQYVFWDDAARTFVLSESRRQVNAVFGSPAATWATNNPAHTLADQASELHIAVGDQGPIPMPRPGEPAGRLTPVHAAGIPIVVVGAVAPRDTVRAIYRRVLATAESLYAERAAHADAVLDATVVLHSPDSLLDLAVRWAALNLDAAMACNPDLGCGLVAGYGAAGATGYRPGFGWYFGGDAAINSLAMTSAGLWAVARDGLAFFARYQGTTGRNAGKIPHEISHGAARIPWFDAFPYAFYHGDTTPFWILALAEYWKASGDTATIRRLWPAIRRAYDWAKGTDGDGDGLMDNTRAGAGAIEVGDLGVGLQSDIYMSGVWVQALSVLPRLAAAMGERRIAEEARRLHARALTALRDELWLEAEGRYAFALLQSGKLSSELTVWPATAMSFGLFAEDRGMATARSLSRATIATDWGARSLASESQLFDPLHYNNGTVWPFVTGWHALGLYRYHHAIPAFASTLAVARTAFLWGLGANPEVFSGSFYEPLETAVPQQFFATSMLLTPLIRGLIGWEADAPGNRMRLAPHLPTWWEHLTVERLSAGSGRYSVDFHRGDTVFAATLTRTAGRGLDSLEFDAALPLATRVREVVVNGRPTACSTRDTGADVHVVCTVAAADTTRVEVRHTRGWVVDALPSQRARGERMSNIKVISQRVVGDTLILEIERPSFARWRLGLRAPGGLSQEVWGREPAGAGDPVDGYVREVHRFVDRPLRP